MLSASLDLEKLLHEIYARLYAHYGPQNWWPAESRWEIMVGAILTQNTAWRNVDRALENLKRANALAPKQIRTIQRARLAKLIRAAGFTASKPLRLKTLAEFLLREYDDVPENMRGGDLAKQRAQLLALNGIGPETADAILLYVAEQPIFVIDAYTRRIMAHIGIVDEKIPYHALQSLFMKNLPHDAALFKEYHALLDTHAKELCTKRAPRCNVCPLNEICLKVGVDVTQIVVK
jgi:endonuclease III related protein